MSQPTPRQVLYAFVSGGVLVVVVILVIGAAAAGIAPVWWTVTMSILVLAMGGWSVVNWRRTMLILLGGIGLFLAWTVGTLLIAR